MSDSNTAGDTPPQSPSDASVRVCCLGIGTETLERVRSRAGELETSIEFVETADPESETGTDCLVVADGADPDWSQVGTLGQPVILFTGRDPVELEDDVLSAVDTIVRRRDGGGGERLLAQKVVGVTRNRQPYADGEVPLETAGDAAAFFVDDGGRIQWSSGAFETLFPVDDVPEARVEHRSLYERVAYLLRDSPDDLRAMLELQGGADRREGTLLEVEGGDRPRYYRHYSYPLEDVAGARVELFQDVTAVVETTDRLTLFERLVENAEDGLFVLDADAEVTYLNESFASMLGYDPAELLGTNATKTIPPAEFERGQAVIEELLASGAESDVIDMRLERKDGERITAAVHFSVRYTEDGGFGGVMGVVRDVTERRERERELERYETIIESMTDAALVVDGDRRIEFANEQALAYLGESLPEVVGTTVEEKAEELGVDSSGKRRYKKAIDAVLGATDGVEYPLRIELELELPDGRRVGEFNCSPLVTDGERKAVVIARDITERKEREWQLEQHRERLQVALEGADAGVWEWDPETGTVVLHDTCKQLFGVDDGAFAGTYEAFTGHVHEDDRAAFERAIETAVPDRESFEVEFRVHRDDGEVLWTNARAEFVDVQGISPRYVGVITDVTELKEREQRLEKFASVVSHDLRNPMDVALGRAEVLPEIADVDDATEKHLDEIFDSLKRMEGLIEDVLTLTRQRDETFDTAPVSLGTVARDAWSSVDTGDATLTVEHDGTIEAHQRRLLRLLENLFRNAVEHGSTSPGEDVNQDAGHAGNTVSVTVGAVEADGDQPTGFYVADDGPGIPDDAKEEVFDDGYSTDQSGTGLGLAIVREIALAHGWSVELTDSAAGGARFEFLGVEHAE